MEDHLRRIDIKYYISKAVLSTLSPSNIQQCSRESSLLLVKIMGLIPLNIYTRTVKDVLYSVWELGDIKRNYNFRLGRGNSFVISRPLAPQVMM